MNDFAFDPDFEPRIADWLEADPDRAPDAVIETVLAAFPSIPQRRAVRAPWRLTLMNRYVLAGGASVATVLAVAIGGSVLMGSRPPVVGTSVSPSSVPASTQASPSATGLLSPTPDLHSIPALTESATSSTGDVTIRYPATWRAGLSTAQPGDDGVGAELPSSEGQGPDAFFSASSVPLSIGQTPEAWLAARHDGCEAQAADAPTPISIGGRSGELKADGCFILGRRWHYLAVVVSGSRGYTFHMDSRLTPVDHRWFEAFLANVSFQP